MELALRYALRYDPLFLDLGRRRAGGLWGGIRSCCIHGALSNESEVLEVIAFLYLMFGPPLQTQGELDNSRKELFLQYEASLRVDAFFSVKPKAESESMYGEVRFCEATVFFSWGSEYQYSVSFPDGTSYPLALPEGDSAYYRSMDITTPNPLITPSLDAAAESFALGLFPKGRL